MVLSNHRLFCLFLSTFLVCTSSNLLCMDGDSPERAGSVFSGSSEHTVGRRGLKQVRRRLPLGDATVSTPPRTVLKPFESLEAACSRYYEFSRGACGDKLDAVYNRILLIDEGTEGENVPDWNPNYKQELPCIIHVLHAFINYLSLENKTFFEGSEHETTLQAGKMTQMLTKFQALLSSH